MARTNRSRALAKATANNAAKATASNDTIDTRTINSVLSVVPNT